MRILFRKNSPGFFSWAIRTASGSIYSHVEIQPYGESCISSSEQDGGVRWASWISGNPEKWDIYEVIGFGMSSPWFTPEYELKVIDWCNAQVGKKYDWRGILQWANPFAKNRSGDLDKYYCSEFCQRGLGLVHWILLDHLVTRPGDLHKLLLELKLIRKVA